jgi:hypothetical protein
MNRWEYYNGNIVNERGNCVATVYTNVADALIIRSAPEALEALLLHNQKPLHPNNPKSKFKSLSDYNQAYKSWAKEFELLKDIAIKKFNTK